ncbi:MAG: DUF805 domain-containing protein [Lactobacillaceae bacterium]|jgi:hypothetical protein|nr:DUF805 domain-containing protein [Lactobacillaceae bacterium]
MRKYLSFKPLSRRDFWFSQIGFAFFAVFLLLVYRFSKDNFFVATILGLIYSFEMILVLRRLYDTGLKTGRIIWFFVVTIFVGLIVFFGLWMSTALPEWYAFPTSSKYLEFLLSPAVYFFGFLIVFVPLLTYKHDSLNKEAIYEGEHYPGFSLALGMSISLVFLFLLSISHTNTYFFENHDKFSTRVQVVLIRNSDRFSDHVRNDGGNTLNIDETTKMVSVVGHDEIFPSPKFELHFEKTNISLIATPKANYIYGTVNGNRVEYLIDKKFKIHAMDNQTKSAGFQETAQQWVTYVVKKGNYRAVPDYFSPLRWLDYVLLVPNSREYRNPAFGN